MRILISGYGRMGREVEKIARSRGHEIVATIDSDEDWISKRDFILNAEVAIDFSLPVAALSVFERCFELGLPVITGTTGWYDDMKKVRLLCEEKKGTLFYAPNFSIGVNLFFRANKQLAKLMSSFEDYRVSLHEIHHVHKLDAPSGTAIKAAEDILKIEEKLSSWKKGSSADSKVLPVTSERLGEVPGTHIVTYESGADLIELKHEAKNRTGFAQGAVLVAEWIPGKKGIFTMDDYLKAVL